MKLLTKELEARFKKVGSQEEVSDPLVICKFFNPNGAGTWYCTEYKDYGQGDKVFFCYVTGLGEDEWGYTSLRDLEGFKGRLGLGIERDLYFKEQPFSNLEVKCETCGENLHRLEKYGRNLCDKCEEHLLG